MQHTKNYIKIRERLGGRLNSVMTSGRVPIFARYRDPTRYASTTYERANEQTIEYTWLHGVVSSGDIQITSSMMFTDTYTQYAERGMTYYDRSISLSLRALSFIPENELLKSIE